MSDFLGPHFVAVPAAYASDFKRDPASALLQYGSLPQRARAPFITDVGDIEAALSLPDQVTGPRAVQAVKPELRALSLVGERDPYALINGLASTFRAPDDGTLWHVAADLALNSRRHGDRAAVAVGRIGSSWLETATDPVTGGRSERVVRSFEIPLVAQITAPVGEQIYLSAVTRFILMLKQLRGFNITSFSADQFQSSGMAQELMLAGLVTAGLRIEPNGEITGTPRPFSVAGRATGPYRDLLEAMHERRVALPDYGILRKELRELELPDAGYAPDHPARNGSKDAADVCAAVVGYLSVHGHTELVTDGGVVDRDDLENAYDLEPAESFGVEDPYAVAADEDDGYFT